MSNIFELKQTLLNIFDIIEENEGELTPELEEQLIITRESFNDKIESYTNVIKLLTKDVELIKEEKTRLNDLQKSKEKTIDRLKSIMVDAIEEFGSTSKSGTKFLDYGRGKVSIRTTQSVEIDEDSTSRFINRFIDCLTYLNIQNQLHKDIIDIQEFMKYANSKSPSEEEEGIERVPFDLEDLKQLKADINLDIPIEELINSDKGFNLIKALIDYNTFDIKPKTNKSDIKREAKERQTMPVFAKLVNNKTITVK